MEKLYFSVSDYVTPAAALVAGIAERIGHALEALSTARGGGDPLNEPARPRSEPPSTPAVDR
jgi:hypothetical protein